MKGSAPQGQTLILDGVITTPGLAQPVPWQTRPKPAPISMPGPCKKCRDRGWYFVDVLNGVTRRCDEPACVGF